MYMIEQCYMPDARPDARLEIHIAANVERGGESRVLRSGFEVSYLDSLGLMSDVVGVGELRLSIC